MLLGMNVPRNDLWAEAIYTASFLRNRLLTKICRNHKTPYKLIHNKPPKLGNVRIFGSRAYVLKRRESRSENFDSRALFGTLVGSLQGNAYRVLLYGTNNIIELQDVRIMEGLDTSQN